MTIEKGYYILSNGSTHRIEDMSSDDAKFFKKKLREGNIEYLKERCHSSDFDKFLDKIREKSIQKSGSESPLACKFLEISESKSKEEKKILKLLSWNRNFYDIKQIQKSKDISDVILSRQTNQFANYIRDKDSTSIKRYTICLDLLKKSINGRSIIEQLRDIYIGNESPYDIPSFGAQQMKDDQRWSSFNRQIYQLSRDIFTTLLTDEQREIFENNPSLFYTVFTDFFKKYYRPLYKRQYKSSQIDKYKSDYLKMCEEFVSSDSDDDLIQLWELVISECKKSSDNPFIEGLKGLNKEIISDTPIRSVCLFYEINIHKELMSIVQEIANTNQSIKRSIQSFLNKNLSSRYHRQQLLWYLESYPDALFFGYLKFKLKESYDKAKSSSISKIEYEKILYYHRRCTEFKTRLT